jgi:exodeoxyribonuclease V alpha subunit
MGAPAEGLHLRMAGEWTSHKTHGRQFRFTSAEVLEPSDKRGLVKYLASKSFRGIGEKTAERIVEALGLEALDVIRANPDKLVGIPGLKGAIREELVATLRTHHADHKLRAFLTGLELNRWQIDAVTKKFGPDCEEALRANPYLLARGISGIAFRTADRAARNLGLAPDAPERIEAALVWLMRQAADDGHELLTEVALWERGLELLGEHLGRGAFVDALALLASRDELVLDDETRRTADGQPVPLVYLPMYHACERLLASNLAALCAGEVPALADEAGLAALEAGAGFELHPDQRAAVLGLVSTPVGLLTGGPGVGKTTVLKLVVDLAERAGLKVVCASPTGRAAKRMSEATGHEAATVHRTLGYDPVERAFGHNQDKPLQAGLVIIDEVSVKAIARPTRLLFVGDPNQLPSVAAGNVLSDLLDSRRIPTWRLTRIFRQDESSRIVTNAHRLLAGERPELPPPVRGDAAKSDFYLFPVEGEDAAAARLVDVVTERIPQTFGLDWTTDVQVLSPMYAGACGVDELNERLRERLPRQGGDRGRELLHRERTWRVGDRVIHTKNDYEREVFNGDMGSVEAIYSDGSGLVVRYPEQDLFYSLDDLADLRPAFAITVHRSQGSEYPCVVVPLVTRHYVMLQRHLLYTAMTRARSLLVLVGSERALDMAIENATQAARSSALADRLQALLPG